MDLLNPITRTGAGSGVNGLSDVDRTSGQKLVTVQTDQLERSGEVHHVMRQGRIHLRVVKREPFEENAQLVAALVILRSDIPTGKALSFDGGIRHALQDGVRLRNELKDRLKIPDGVKESFVNQFKYQLKDGQLALSVYTVLEGKRPIPENSHTVEHIGSPYPAANAKNWAPKVDVFGLDKQDDVHVGRSAAFLALLQTTKVSLQSASDYASRFGFVYRVEPEVYFKEGDTNRGVPVLNVLILTKDGKTERLKIAIPQNR